ncbi:hypothetical protein AALO_G00089340 [Alosa alosa]|uniref:Uncharacterized protein n=1 Tax=Alosa alosa TaxID=278164 RepID=A0AAV6GUW9_9TELE|nr:uncharacterized protein LOC125297919 [Alosa alosa]XP_048104439.1 uncharacterized protein LOC125297919 [Alosa alosa]XP_048104440.1 uncharacterized protein LOC125297919 [Alosa alosa]KAG5277606.1 hypothetical protein AALO_G00089340 [Alosa alosa]
MGNTALTIHHPTSLEHDIPYLEHGKVVDSTASTLCLEKSGGAVVGCGGRVVFKKTASDSQWTYRASERISDCKIGDEITVLASDQAEANTQIAARFGMSLSEVRESVTLIKSTIGDSSAYSELYCYVDYNVKSSGRHEWTRNDLYLKATHRWAESSEMVIDITFLTEEEKEIEKEKQKEMAETMRNVIFMFGNNTTDVTRKT